jgi:hypothetical protein
MVKTVCAAQQLDRKIKSDIASLELCTWGVDSVPDPELFGLVGSGTIFPDLALDLRQDPTFRTKKCTLQSGKVGHHFIHTYFFILKNSLKSGLFTRNSLGQISSRAFEAFLCRRKMIYLWKLYVHKKKLDSANRKSANHKKGLGPQIATVPESPQIWGFSFCGIYLPTPPSPPFYDCKLFKQTPTRTDVQQMYVAITTATVWS